MSAEQTINKVIEELQQTLRGSGVITRGLVRRCVEQLMKSKSYRAQAIATDASRLCDGNKHINYHEQFKKSENHVDYVAKQSLLKKR